MLAHWYFNEGKAQQVNYIKDDKVKKKSCGMSWQCHKLNDLLLWKRCPHKWSSLYYTAQKFNMNNATLQCSLQTVITGGRGEGGGGWDYRAFIHVCRVQKLFHVGFFGSVWKVNYHSSVSALGELVGVDEHSITQHQKFHSWENHHKKIKPCSINGPFICSDLSTQKSSLP